MIGSTSSKVRFISSGSKRSCVKSSWVLSVVIVPFKPETYIANKNIVTSWVVYAFVEATAISGPAHVYITWSASRAIEEPTTFVIAKVFAPRRLDSLSAASVSLVSPDWLITIVSVCSSMIGSRYLNSEAISISTGIRANFSM